VNNRSLSVGGRARLVAFVSFPTVHVGPSEFPVKRSLILGVFDTLFFFVLSVFRVFVIAILLFAFCIAAILFDFLPED
jgi:hypothetical protein